MQKAIRGRATGAIATICLLLPGLTGCLSVATELNCEDFGTPMPPTEEVSGGTVAVIQGSLDFPDSGSAIRQSSAIRASLPVSSDQVPHGFGIVLADGSPNLLFQSWVKLEGLEVEGDLPRKTTNAQASLATIYSCAFKSTKKFGSIDANVDLIGGLGVAAGALSEVVGEKTIVVFSNGLQTAGSPDFSQLFPGSFEDVDAVVSQLKKARALPDLQGVSVEWVGLGQVTEGLPVLEQKDKNILEYFWRQVILEGGGDPPESFGSAALGNLPREGAASSKQVAEIESVCLFVLDATQGFAFRPNTADFVNPELALLGAESIARQISEADCGSRELRVTGYTASGKSQQEFEEAGPNFALSERRASAFASLLEGLGVNVAEVIGGGKGPHTDWDSEGNFTEELGKKNRIVIVEEIQ